MNKLGLKDLAPYLPYGLSCHAMGESIEGKPILFTLMGLSDDLLNHKHAELWAGENEDGTTEDIITMALDDTFPLLRPMSDLTEEITHGDETFVPMEKLAQIAFERLDTFHIHSDIEIITAYKTDEKEAYRTLKYDADNKSFVVSVLDENLFRIRNLATKNQYDLFQKLCEWHIDFQGLIGRGVAINLHTIDNGK
ncbi:hypothetical protein [Elizabethkingia anophelis]|uniref:hypothetical protein n=1 Tax=Elizabethkingia anophelis TaxID=1117645 RepID=UPI003892CC5E